MQITNYLIWEDNNIRPREFNIELDAGIRGDNLVSTIIHEMVHVWQYARGRLVDTKFVNKKKWLAWKAHSGKSKEDAEKEYIALVDKLSAQYN